MIEIEAIGEGPTITSVENTLSEPNERDTRLATLAAIADERINGTTAQPFADWLRITHQPNGELEARKMLGISKVNQEIDNFLLSEADEPVATPQEMLDILQAKQQINVQEAYRNILETETAATLTDQSMSDPVRGAVIEAEELSVEESQQLLSMDRSENLTAALLKLNNLQMKYAKELFDIGLDVNLAKHLAILVPMMDTYAQFANGERNMETLGDALRRESSEIFNGPDPLGAVTRLEEKLNNSDLPTLFKLDLVSTKSIGEVEASIRSIFEVVDATGALAILGKSLSALTKVGRLSRLAKVADNPQASVNTAKELAERAKPGSPSPLSDDEFEELIQAAITSHGKDFTDNTTGRVAAVLQEQADELDAINIIRGQNFLSEEEKLQAIEKLKVDIKQSYPNVTAIDVEDTDDFATVAFKLGTGEDNLSSYVSMEAAVKAAERLGIQPGFYKVEKAEGVYHLKVFRDINDIGQDGKSFLKGFDSPNGLVTPLFLNKYLTGNKINLNFAERLADGGIVGVNAAALLNEIFKNSSKLITKLSKNERTSFDAVMAYTQNNNGGRWLSSKQFDDFFSSKLGRKATEDERIAYGAAIQLHRADEAIINSAIRNDFIQKGFQEIGIAGVRDNKTIGKIIPTFDRKNLKNISIFDGTTGKHYPVGTASKGLVEKLLKEDDLVLVKYLDEVPVVQGKGSLTEAGAKIGITIEDEFASLGQEAIKAQYVIAKKTSVGQTALRHRLLKHFDGPHREYKDPYFIKQSKTLDGTFLTTRTHFNVGSESQALKYANEYNIALDAFLRAERATIGNAANSGELQAQATKIIQENTHFSSWDEMKQAVDSGKIERTPFEAWGDGAARPYNATAIGKTSKDYSPDVMDIDADFMGLSETTKKYINSGQLYYSARGQHLKSPDGKLAPILDSREILENSIKHIIHTRAFGEYKARHVKQWVQTYKEYLDTASEIRPDWYHFTHGKFRTDRDVPTTISTSGERVRIGLNRVLHAQSYESKRLNNWKLELASYATGDSTGVYDKLKRSGTQGLLKLLESDPVTGVRALVFKTFLGMMDASQVIVQTAMAPAVMGAFPRIGPQALTMLIPLRLSTMVPAGGKAFEYIASGVSTLGLAVGRKPMKPKDIKAMMEDMRKSGVDIVGGSQAQLDNPFDGNSLTPSKLLQYGNKALDVGLIPFKEGERLNQMLGFSIAWLKHFSNTGKRPSVDELGRVLNQAETIAGNMKSSSRAAWQSGIASVPTQFMAHPVRVIENILFQQAGGLNKKQRAGFVTGILATYGMSGLGFDETGDKAAELYAEATDQELTPEIINAIKNGWVGHVFDNYDISRVQPLKDNIIGAVFNNIVNDEKFQMSDFGPSMSLAGDTATAIGGSLLFRGMTEGVLELKDTPDLTANIMKEMFSNLPGPSRLTKAWSMYAYGELRNKRGDLVDAQDYTNFDVAMQALGFPPKDSREASNMARDINDVRKAIQPHVKRAVQLARQFVEAETEDEKRKAAHEYSLWIQLYKNQDDHVRIAFEKALFNGLKNQGKNLTQENLSKLYNFFGRDYVNKRLPRRD